MSQSVASQQFPQTVWREGKKHLWNPIQRRALKNLPEERVRLRVLEYLIRGGWSKHRISTEEAIEMPQKEAKLRTDLICYTKDFKPFLLVECKAENINLSAKTAEQIARYNQQVSAPYLLMTNGRTDFWYNIDEGTSPQPLHHIPGALPDVELPETDFEYWHHRGMAGAKATPALRLWLNQQLNIFLTGKQTGNLHHLAFKNSPGDLDFTQYYRIFEIEQHRLALGFAATEFGGSRLACILNRNGQNEAVAEINLDLLFDGRAPNASIYWTDGPENVDIRQHFERFTDRSITKDDLVPELSKYLIAIIS